MFINMQQDETVVSSRTNQLIVSSRTNALIETRMQEYVIRKTAKQKSSNIYYIDEDSFPLLLGNKFRDYNEESEILKYLKNSQVFSRIFSSYQLYPNPSQIQPSQEYPGSCQGRERETDQIWFNFLTGVWNDSNIKGLRGGLTWGKGGQVREKCLFFIRGCCIYRENDIWVRIGLLLNNWVM